MSVARPEPRPFPIAPLIPGDGPIANAACRVAEACLGIGRIRDLYGALPPYDSPEEFFALALQALSVTLEYRAEAWDRLPGSGPRVVVVNHPFGIIEGIALGAMLSDRQIDFRFLGNFLVNEVPAMRPFTLAVDPFGRLGSARRNVAALRGARRWLDEGGVLVLFPAGEVAHWNFGARRVLEAPWAPHVARLARHAGATVMPVHFAGTNSALFHALGAVHPLLRTAWLPRELLNKRGRTVHIEVGEPIRSDALAAFPGDHELVAHLREVTLALGEGVRVMR